MADFRTELVRAARAEFERFNRRPETDATVRDILIEYWTIGAERTVSQASKEIKNRTPWSAAFISFVVRRALKESGSRAKFEFNASHSAYIGAAIRNDQSAITGPAFLGLPPTGPGAEPPVVGDLVGATRQRDIDDYGDALTAARRKQAYSSHVDVVIEKGGGKITTIGGNVGDTVGTRPVSLTSDGLLPLRPFKFNSEGGVVSGPFICVVKHRA